MARFEVVVGPGGPKIQEVKAPTPARPRREPVHTTLENWVEGTAAMIRWWEKRNQDRDDLEFEPFDGCLRGSWIGTSPSMRGVPENPAVYELVGAIATLNGTKEPWEDLGYFQKKAQKEARRVRQTSD